jgi:hypothetical protein
MPEQETAESGRPPRGSLDHRPAAKQRTLAELSGQAVPADRRPDAVTSAYPSRSTRR